MERDCDVVVIGAGPAGEIAAGRLAENGRNVVIVEQELVGGECSFYSCMPSKALLRPGELLAEVGRVPGVLADGGRLDAAAVLARRDEVIAHLDDSSQVPWLQQRRITLVRGRGRLEGATRVRVGDDLLFAREAVILATGSGPVIPPIPGLAEAAAWSNREITTATTVPASLTVLGGGVVGVEMAQAWASLGSDVTIVEALDRLLAREEPYVGEEIAAALRDLGVTVHIGRKATAVTRQGQTTTVTLEDGTEVTGSELLVAIGRRPHSEDLGLESVGLSGRGPVPVDDQLRVDGVPGLYAVGDINGRSLLTHSGKYQARIAADHILGRPARAWADLAGAPRVIFCDPQVAAVGVTFADAREQGVDAIAIDLPTSGTAGASFYGRGAAGTSRFVVDRDRERLIGVTFVGAEVADFLQAATVAVIGEVSLGRLAHAIAPFPTRSELWLKFIEAYEAETGHSLHADPDPDC
ncbi:NAD(P)/FAD-dependent oxidoreductase [Conexibacter sp. DBS9H8]|uniref:dihydrolipoyl dehydrogenase family protein n=1 Tax=Conexibacter sp. DBS9H8 TaxID=2937801 RepID=UPI00200C7166|nr:NAD(P)/FAD-dependent oxidoreductase [Conexibacter sp. DBS9H8]